MDQALQHILTIFDPLSDLGGNTKKKPAEVLVEVDRILAEIDAQILKLQQARNLLAGPTPTRTGPGRPKGSKNSARNKSGVVPEGKRKLSAEGRRRIGEAMKKRWAERRKEAAKLQSK